MSTSRQTDVPNKVSADCMQHDFTGLLVQSSQIVCIFWVSFCFSRFHQFFLEFIFFLIHFCVSTFFTPHFSSTLSKVVRMKFLMWELHQRERTCNSWTYCPWLISSDMKALQSIEANLKWFELLIKKNILVPISLIINSASDLCVSCMVS